jgi:hypothetical protein
MQFVEALQHAKAYAPYVCHYENAAELDAVHLAISPRDGGDISMALRVVMERLESADFAATVARAREKLQIAMS